jgi:hypothetical protein
MGQHRNPQAKLPDRWVVQRSMTERFSLDVIDVATPCPTDWETMRGNDRVRFCNQCSLHVYNLSAMTRVDAERLISTTEGRLCVKFYRRADGTVVTDDCTRSRKAARMAGRAWTVAYAVTAAMACALLAPLGFGASSEKCVTNPLDVEVSRDVIRVIGEARAPVVQLQGDIVVGLVPPPLPATRPTTLPATQPAR